MEGSRFFDDLFRSYWLSSHYFPLPPFFCLFFFTPNQLITCCLSFTHAVFRPSLFSCSLSPLLKWPGALWISTGVRKGQPYCPRVAGFAHAATCLSLICVNAGGVTVLAPHHLNCRTPTLSPVQRRPLAHTPECDEANTQTCGIPKRMGAGWVGGGGVRSTPRRLTAIIRNKSRSPAATSPPFPHTSHYRGLFLSLNPAPAGVCLVGRKAHVMGRE